MESVTDTPEIKLIIKQLRRKRIQCGNDISDIETRLRNKYMNEILNKNDEISIKNAKEMAEALVENVFQSQSAEKIIENYTGKNGKIRAPGSAVSNSLKYLISRFSRKNPGASAPPNTTARKPNTKPNTKPAAPGSSFGSRLGSLGSRVGSVFTRKNPSANARNSNMKSVVPIKNESNTSPLLGNKPKPKSIRNRFKGLFGSKPNTRKNLLNVDNFTKDIIQRMAGAEDMTELNYLYNEIRRDFEKLAPKSKNKKKVDNAISSLEGAFIKRRRELQGPYTNKPGNSFNEQAAKERQAELLATPGSAAAVPASAAANKNKPSATAAPTPAAANEVDLLKMGEPPNSAAAPVAAPAAPPTAPKSGMNSLAANIASQLGTNSAAAPTANGNAAKPTLSELPKTNTTAQKQGVLRAAAAAEPADPFAGIGGRRKRNTRRKRNKHNA